MAAVDLPYILEPDTLEAQLGREKLLVIDLSKAETHVQAHVPGAVHLEFPRIVRSNKPVVGLLPDEHYLCTLFGQLGIDADTHVVAYDDEGGGKAARLIWTLHVLGHTSASLLNGGLYAWANEHHRLDAHATEPRRADFQCRFTETEIADKKYILDHLDDTEFALLDARSAEEYSGAKRLSARGGHIPGAVNSDWQLTLDRDRNLRLQPQQALRDLFEQRQITPDQEVIVYCQSHQRSAHTYVVLKSLGYPRVRGYAGAWSDWGNDASTPIAN